MRARNAGYYFQLGEGYNMNFIEIPIVCYVTKSEKNEVNELLEKLDLPVEREDDETENRIGKLQIGTVSYYYPNSNPKTTTVELITGTHIIVSLTYSEFDKLIEDANA